GLRQAGKLEQGAGQGRGGLRHAARGRRGRLRFAGADVGGLAVEIQGHGRLVGPRRARVDGDGVRGVVDGDDREGPRIADPNAVAVDQREAVGEVAGVLQRDRPARSGAPGPSERHAFVDAAAARRELEVLRRLRIRDDEGRHIEDVVADVARELLLGVGEADHAAAVLHVEGGVVAPPSRDQVTFDNGLADDPGRVRPELEDDVRVRNGAAVREHDVVLEDVARHAVAAVVEHEPPGGAFVRVQGVVVDAVVVRPLLAGAALRRDALVAVRDDDVTPDDVALTFDLHPGVALPVRRALRIAHDVILEDVVLAHQREVATALAASEDLAPVVVEDVVADDVAFALDLQQVVRAASDDVALDQVVTGFAVDLDGVAPVLAVAVVVHADHVDDVVYQLV